MKCFRCGKGKMILQTAEVTGEVRGETLTVRCECMMCDRCGFQALSEEQSNAYAIKSADVYRRRHKLLTSKALKAIRRRLGLSQQRFAAFLKVGVASVKRWETGLVQDESHDQLIRLRTDLSLAKRNVQEIETRSKGAS
jgi:putative zinc finger/helix-turn-helix YgiT family protein